MGVQKDRLRLRWRLKGDLTPEHGTGTDIMDRRSGKKAVIIGGGPAGLTAAFELCTRSRIKPVVFEASELLGGIARTVNHNGNRIDIGGHRFFSKSDRVMEWWLNVFPLQKLDEGQIELKYRGRKRSLNMSDEGPDPDESDNVMLVRKRLSRILYLRKFFDYPVSLNWNTISNLGLLKVFKIGLSYSASLLSPGKKEETLEDFFINRFGRELYETFFKDYTEKVWGRPCREITAEWGAQRVKGLSIAKALAHAAKRSVKLSGSISQKEIETSLIEYFLYPKLGPGQLWEEVGRRIREKGGEILLRHKVTGIDFDGAKIRGVNVFDLDNNTEICCKGDLFFSTMPVRDLILNMSAPNVPQGVKDTAKGLEYRDFITVGVLLKKVNVCSGKTGDKNGLPDNWIYVQEHDVKLGRIQVFNNWSPYLVKDSGTVWLGLEYFCCEGDELWSLSDKEMSRLAEDELKKLKFIDDGDLLDSVVIRMEKTYPAYFGSYDRFNEIREFTDNIPNLYLIGRNGMHRYNNQDHSMLTAMTAVDNILAGRKDKNNIWDVNTESEYHEER